MKSIHLWLFPFFLTLSVSTSLLGQENSDGILLHKHPTTVPAVPTLVSTPPSFPSLSPRADNLGSSHASEGESGKSKIAGPAVTVTSSLAVVLGLFAGLVWLTRKYGTRSMSQGAVPKEVLQSLGSTPIDARTRITMLRCGDRILVMAQTATGVHPLTEITDPDEVRRLAAACLGDSKTNFASTIQSVEREAADAGFLGTDDSPAPPTRGRLFATA